MFVIGTILAHQNSPVCLNTKCLVKPQFANAKFLVELRQCTLEMLLHSSASRQGHGLQGHRFGPRILYG